MIEPRKSLLDNWSLEHAGFLLNGDTDIGKITQNDFINNFGGLSNYINALLLYDQTAYLSNGFEKDWNRFEWFTKNTLSYVEGLSAKELEIDWESDDSYSDQGISNYLKSSNTLGLDLFVSPERATILKEKVLRPHSTTFEILIKKIDDKIAMEADGIWLPETRLGIIENFRFPSLTQYVLSESSRSDELLTVILQMRHDGKINRIFNELNEIALDTKRVGGLQKEMESRIKLAFGDKSKSDTSFTVKVGALFVSLNKTISLGFLNRRVHILFLKDIISCRAESGHLRKNIKRLFGKTLV